MSDTTTTIEQPSAEVSGRPIRLDDVTKRYPGQTKPAVDGITLEIPAGKVVMFVGPSGCGKTTTLKMINRLIEPTNGRIVLGDEDVTQIDGDELRRRIGYVIQAGGLFPHMTVATNIGLVPKMLGWSKERIAARVDELLELVSLDPDTYRDRYPRELSGGQQQRVGVARALAADPPVLLMDEPFGAVDPITRQRLQDELIRIQEEVQKTMVIVTHDFDEAVKLGDWIVVFEEGARIVQYDTPERILAEPANEFVENFIGSGAGLKQLTLRRVRDVDVADAVVVKPGTTGKDALQQAENAGHGHVVVVDDRERPLQWLSRRQLSRIDVIDARLDPALPVVSGAATLNDALDTMLVTSVGAALVTGRRERFEGVIDVETVMEAIRDARANAANSEGAPVGMNSGSIGLTPSLIAAGEAAQAAHAGDEAATATATDDARADHTERGAAG
ncbi:betaine/proline/choline family ABC transporter ATP-binding protein [Schumannella soli]|uniref:ABC-type quaternary amine transporter n=1 Tax=Schumannella soli TaxID=2590779 RepID=A0A506XYQ5_9MICO|nr:betaine/proline/choline family ABC transporter ATP-binding protein [Schumannella soli]TPW77891.1 betaine/proline/choline family ABC transporter ATP-binding protein [Schumannella soli]